MGIKSLRHIGGILGLVLGAVLWPAVGFAQSNIPGRVSLGPSGAMIGHVVCDSGCASGAANRTASGSVTNNGDTLAINVSGMATVTVTITTQGTDGHVLTQASNDGGVNWSDVFTVNDYNGFNGPIAQVPFGASGAFIFPVAGYDTFRLTLTGKTSGSSNSYALQAASVAWTFPRNITTIEGTLGNGVVVSGAGAMSVTLSNAFIRAIPYDGLRDGVVKGASTPAAAADNALVVAVSPNNSVAVVQPTGTNLHVVCDGGTCGGAASFADNSAFTAGTTGITNIGAVFNDGLAAVTAGNAAAPRITNTRGMHVNLRTAAGVEIPLPTALGQTTMAGSSPVVIASDQSAVPLVNSSSSTTSTLAVTGANQTVIASNLSGMGSLAVQTVQTGYLGSGTGIAAYDISADGGATYTTNMSFINGANTTNSFTTQGNINRLHYIPLHGGVTNVRLRVVQIGQGSLAITAVAGTEPLAVPADTLTSNQGTTAGTNAAAWWTRIGDTTNGPVAVKAASTVAATTDPALVVRSIQLPTAVGQTTMAASLPVTIASDQSALAVTGPITDTQIRATPLPVSGTLTTSPPANASTNVAQLAGTTTSVNSGVKDAGTLRVVLATDQPALTNKLLVTPDSVALPANQSVNVAQFGGTNTVTGTGASGAGIPRVTIANDSSIRQTTAVTASATLQAAATATGNGTPFAVDGMATAVLTVSSTAGTSTVVFETTEDGTNYKAVQGYAYWTVLSAGFAFTSVTPANGPYVLVFPVSGMTFIRARISAYTSGAVTVTGHASPVTYGPVPAQPVLSSQAATFATSAVITDGISNGTLKAASTLPALTDTALVTTQRDPLPAGTNVIGHVIQDTGSTTAVTGNVTAVQATGTNLHVVSDATSTTAVTQATAANLNATVTQLTLTKGTQGATGVSTQDLKDAGRSAKSFYANNVASGTTTTETLITLTQSSGTGATSAASTYTITNGKTFRITALSVASRGNATATIQSTVFNLRLNTAGACVVTSTPILFAAQSATPATASAWDRVIIPIPDGYEIAGNGTISICISAAATFVTNAPTWSVNLIGFEY